MDALLKSQLMQSLLAAREAIDALMRTLAAEGRCAHLHVERIHLMGSAPLHRCRECGEVIEEVDDAGVRAR